MGFIRANVLPILKEHKLRPFSGHILCLGKPDVYFTYDHLLRMAEIADITLLSDIPITRSHVHQFARKNYISGETLFRSIGFNQISSLDYSSFEGAEYVVDLNSGSLPGELRKQFDVVIDHGTIEHIFHIPNVLNNIYQMLEIGGRIIHSSPGTNFFDHGFYGFSPTLFYDFYLTNKWKLRTIQVFQMTPNQETDPPFFTDYEPGMFAPLSYGGMGDKMYGTICIAEKTSESTGTAIPQQGLYARMAGWEKDMTLGEKSVLILKRLKALYQTGA